MTQILRPTIETTNDGFYYDLLTHPSSLAVSPAGAAFPYGTPSSVQQIGLVWPDTTAFRPSSGASTSYGLTDPRFYTYKGVSAPATLEGQSLKTVTYSGFPAFTDAWATGALILQIGSNSTGTIMSNDIAPVTKIEYSWNNGSTWNPIYERLWDVDGGDAGGGHRWLQPSEHLGAGVTAKVNAFANNQNVTSGYAVSLVMTGHDTTKLQIRFSVKGGYIIPPSNTNSAPFYIGAGFQIADVHLTDPSYTAPPPGGTGSTASTPNTLVIKSGPGSIGSLDSKTQFAQMVNGAPTNWKDAFIPTPSTAWGLIPGTNWISYETSAKKYAAIISKLTSPGWATPLPGSNWVSVNDGTAGSGGISYTQNTTGGVPISVSKARFRVEFSLPSVTSAVLSLQLISDDQTTLYLNGVKFSQQQNNQSGPFVTHSTSVGFVTGVNVLEFDVVNYGGPLGVCFKGQVSYSGGSVALVSGSGAIGSTDLQTSYTILSGVGQDSTAGTGAGTYLARTSFVLPIGFQSASLSLTLMADNAVSDIILNGHSIGGQPTGGSTLSYFAPGTETTHTSSSNFVGGTNYIDFVVVNYLNAMALDFLGQITYVAPSIGATGTTGATGATGTIGVTGGGISTPDFDNQIITIGGSPAYSYSIVNDAQTTLPLAAVNLSGSTLRVNGTTVPAGTYSVHLRVTDMLGAIDDQVVTVNVYDSAKFNIINQSTTLSPAQFPYAGSIPLVQYGGSGTVTWALISATTTLPSAAISGQNLVFTSTQLGTYQVGLTATDSMGKLANKVVRVTVTSANAYKLVDGQIELVYSDSSGVASGNHNFSFGLRDKTHTLIQRSYSYLLNPAPSVITPKQYSVNKYWASNDSAPLSLPISGSISGVTLGDVAAVLLTNGIKMSTVGAASSIVFSGTPTLYENSIAFASVPLLRGSENIGVIHRAYMVTPYNGTALNQLGTNTVNTIPAIVGQMFTLNPQKPYFNSPDNSRDATWTSRVMVGSYLPKGVSLDRNTGLLYGPIVDAASTSPATLEFVDAAGSVRGTFTVKFDFVTNDFDMISNLPIGKVGTPYSEGSILTNSTSAVSSASLHWGHLPAGLTLGVSANTVTLRGTPTEAGYFDVWIKAVNADSKTAYLYRRLEITYIVPLSLVTAALPSVKTGSVYSAQMQAVGGSGKYIWTLGSGVLPTGVTMSSAGLISGTTALSSYSQAINFIVTDSVGATANVTITLAINNTLIIITTSPLPAAIVGQPYNYQLQAEGGTTPYHSWALDSGSPAFPAGLTINSSTGVISGTVTAPGYSQNLVVKVTDTASTTVNKTLQLITKDTRVVIGIDAQGIGVIKRGCTYQGVLRATGTNTVAPFRWTAVGLPVGLVVTPNTADQGATAFISGATTETFSNKAVPVTVIDAGGGTVTSSVVMTSAPSVGVTYPVDYASLPQGKVGTAYSIRLTAQSCNNPWTFALNVSSPALPAGFALNSNGTLGGTPVAPYNQTIIVDVTDSIGDVATTHLNFQIVSSSLVISTTEIPTVPAGQGWNFQLQATGGQQPFTWVAADPLGTTTPASGWSVLVGVSGDGVSGFASGTYTVTASGGSGTYLGTGTFAWEQPYTSPLNSYLRYIDSSAVLTINVTDVVTKETISGVVRVPLVVNGLNPNFAISLTETLTGMARPNKVLPDYVTLTPTGLLTTAGTSDTFNEPVLFTVTDSLGAVATKVLAVQVLSTPATGALQTGIDYRNGATTNFLGFIGTSPGDIATLTPRPFSSFYIYGTMTGALASQLVVTTSVDNGGTPYSNITGIIESVNSNGLIALKLVFNPISAGMLNGPSPLTYEPAPTDPTTHGVAVTVTNTATGAKLTGNFNFITQNFGEITLNQASGVSLPTFSA